MDKPVGQRGSALSTFISSKSKSREQFPGFCIADDLNYLNVLNGLNAFKPKPEKTAWH